MWVSCAEQLVDLFPPDVFFALPWQTKYTIFRKPLFSNNGMKFTAVTLLPGCNLSLLLANARIIDLLVQSMCNTPAIVSPCNL